MLRHERNRATALPPTNASISHAACLSRVHVSLRFRMSERSQQPVNSASKKLARNDPCLHPSSIVHTRRRGSQASSCSCKLLIACHLCDACSTTRAKRPRRHEQLCRCEAGSDVTCCVSRLHGNMKPLARTRQFCAVCAVPNYTLPPLWRLYLDRLVCCDASTSCHDV